MPTILVNPASHDRFDKCSPIHSSTRSQVWKCWDNHTESWVALKTSTASPPKEVLELLRQINHPNVVQAIGTQALGTQALGSQDAGIEDALILQFVPGQPLIRLPSKQSPLPEATAVQILRECSQALSAMHARGIVHGDIAPANVIVDEQLARATLIDIELATSGQRSRGTPVTMSPEVASGQPPTPRSDVYSLGCLAYFMLTGTHVFSGATSLEICWKQKSHPCPSLQSDPGSTRPEIRPELATLVDRMLAKQPSQRPDSATQITDHLSSLAD